MAATGDGFLVAGTTYSPRKPGEPSLFVVRLTQDGRIDRSYGDHGATVISLPSVHPGAVLVDPMRQATVAASAVGPDGKRRVCLIRLSPDGHLESSFGQGGVAWVDLDNDPGVLRASLQGTSVIVGATVEGSALRLARVTDQGNEDRTFGTNGVLDPGIIEGGFLLAHIERIIVSGRLPRDNHNETETGRVVAFSKDGQLDSSFGSGGSKVTDQPLRLLTVDDQGRFLTVADVFDGANPGYSFARLTPNGGYDHSFGQSGRTPVNRGGKPFVVNAIASPQSIRAAINFANSTAHLKEYTLDGSALHDYMPDTPHRFEIADATATETTAAAVGTSFHDSSDFGERYMTIWLPRP